MGSASWSSPLVLAGCVPIMLLLFTRLKEGRWGLRFWSYCCFSGAGEQVVGWRDGYVTPLLNHTVSLPPK